MPASGYTAITFVADQLLTSTIMNQMAANDAAFNTGAGLNDNAIVARHIADGAIAPAKITNPYKFSVYQTSNPGLNNTVAKVPHNTKLFDTNNNFNTALNRYVAPVTGYYQFNMQVQCGSAGMGNTEASLSYLYKNGSEYRRSLQLIGSGNSNQIVRTSINTLEYIVAGDYLEHYAQMLGSRDISGGFQVTFFQGFLVSQT